MKPQLYLKRERIEPEIFEINFLRASNAQLLKISGELGLALNLKEMGRCRDYFKNKKRNPTDVELQMIGQTWSEHCCHKTFKGDVKIGKKKLNLFKDCIKAPTAKLSPPWCISVFEDNAGIVDFERGYAIAAKVETHNHPSAIEPFGGSATGVGGVIRDILGVWAKPIANLDVLGFGPLDYPYEKLPRGVKHPRYLFTHVVAGIGAYGNNMGIPTVNGAICFDESYVGNVVVYCGCVGLLETEKYVHDTQLGDLAILAGGRTGRDGIHGVTFASAELTEKSEELSRPAVQIADPIEEEKLKRVILRIRDEKLASGITDLGGGGLSCAAGEVAERSGYGIEIDLEKVPLKYPEMKPWEIWISESQERMLITIPEKNLERVMKIFEEEDVEATPVGRFVPGNNIQVKYCNHLLVDLELKFLFNPPRVTRRARWKRLAFKEPNFPPPKDLNQTMLRLLSTPNICSKESVVRTYDHEVQGNTILKPLQGKSAGPNDAAVIKPLDDSWKGVVISSGIKPSYGKIDPYWMAASALEEAIRNNLAVGGRRIALLDNFVWGNPERSEQLGGLIRASLACRDFAGAFGTPFISGKDSLYNESPLGPITPTLLVTAIGMIPDVRKTVSVELKEEGNPIYVLGKTYPELGGSEYYRLHGFLGKSVPRVRKEDFKHLMISIPKAINQGAILTCHDLSEGGLAVTAAEMVLGSNGIGMGIDLRRVPASIRRDDLLLFSESNGRFLVEVAADQENEFKKAMKGCIFSKIGKVVGTNGLRIMGLKRKLVVNLPAEKLRSAWGGTLGV
jgi:phosphoribosylformylglycinamidine synthase